MDFFGIGPMELFLIIVLALIVFGPGKLPEIARQLGRAVREFRKASSALTRDFKEEFQKGLNTESVRPAENTGVNRAKEDSILIKAEGKESPDGNQN